MKKRQFKKAIKKLQVRACYGLNSIKPGDIVFSNGKQYIIKSGVYLKQTLSEGIFCMKAEVSFYDGTTCSILEDLYLSDLNVVEGGYNLYRVFHSKEDSLKYDLFLKKIISYEKNHLGRVESVYSVVKPSKTIFVSDKEKRNFLTQQKIGKLTLTYTTH